MKKFVEFDDWVLSIEDIICTCRQHSIYSGENGKQKWYSGIFMTDNRFVKIPEEYFDELKEILLKYENNN